MHKLRYYAPSYRKDIHAEILRLLEVVKATHDIPYEVREIVHQTGSDPNYYVLEEPEERMIYEKDFLPRKGILRGRLGESLNRLLRTRSKHFCLAGTVAITRVGLVEWFSSFAMPFREFDKNDPALGFLKALQEGGLALLEELTPPVEKGAPELSIIDTFVSSGVLEGSPEREVKVGGNIFEVAGGRHDWRKSIDLVCKTLQVTWVIEGKTSLNYEALGGVLVYATLYERGHPAEMIKKGIVCGIVDEDLLMTCKKYGVTVFQVLGEKVRRYPA